MELPSNTMTDEEEKELITQAELAKRLRVTKRTIQADKQIPRIEWGRNVRYSWREVVEHLRNRKPRQ